MKWLVFGVLLLISGSQFLPLSSGSIVVPRYAFVKIADTSDGRFTHFNTCPSIDNQGRVIFRGDLRQGGMGIFIGDGKTLEQIAATSDFIKTFPGHPTLSGNGQAVFLAQLENGAETYFWGSMGEIKRLLDTDRFSELGGIVVNDQGLVAFKARSSQTRDWRRRIFLGGIHGPKEISHSAHSHLGLPSINNLGDSAFSLGDEVWVGNGKRSWMVAGKKDGYMLYSRPIINDGGTIVVQAATNNSHNGVEKLLLEIRKDKIETLASTYGAYGDFFSLHSLNKHGAVVFSARLDSGNMGLFTGRNPTQDAVIVEGDPLMGSPITQGGGPVLSNHSLNDYGQVAFFARLENGVEGIYRADPASLPQQDGRELTRVTSEAP